MSGDLTASPRRRTAHLGRPATFFAAPTSFPADAEAIIYRSAKSAMTSGRAGLRSWILEFKPRSPLFIEPLMGWTGSTDPLSQDHAEP
jgi:hypothetical protein